MKKGASTSDARYPAFPPASAPPMPDAPHHMEAAEIPTARPVYHYSQANPQQPQYLPPHQPLLQPQPVMYQPPRHSGDYRQEGCCSMTVKLVVFHMLNAILGITGFSLVVTGVSLSFGLLPLCCFGIIVFRVVLYMVRFLAQLDVELYNFISPAEEHVYLSIPERAVFVGMEGRRLSPSLSSFSPLALMATLYFLTIKFVMGILSCVAVSVALSLPSAEIITRTTDLKDVYAMGINVRQFDAESDPVTFALVWICMLLISVALMHIVARLSRSATRFFCCERFSTYRYVYGQQYPTAFPAAATAYGATTVTF
ncbi:hypothetical protein ATCC90586_000228 [Pythium insidiosum]|nr:hypothetical protein ATCC90586_000228 [Pythium insidiosum]